MSMTTKNFGQQNRTGEQRSWADADTAAQVDGFDPSVVVQDADKTIATLKPADSCGDTQKG